MRNKFFIVLAVVAFGLVGCSKEDDTSNAVNNSDQTPAVTATQSGAPAVSDSQSANITPQSSLDQGAMQPQSSVAPLPQDNSTMQAPMPMQDNQPTQMSPDNTVPAMPNEQAPNPQAAPNGMPTPDNNIPQGGAFSDNSTTVTPPTSATPMDQNNLNQQSPDAAMPQNNNGANSAISDSNAVGNQPAVPQASNLPVASDAGKTKVSTDTTDSSDLDSSDDINDMDAPCDSDVDKMSDDGTAPVDAD